MIFNYSHEGKHLMITKGTWDEMKKDKSSVAFTSLEAAARETIRRDGAFIVYREEDTAIMRRCDRMSELDDEIAASAITPHEGNL